jgi:hypothetical protein
MRHKANAIKRYNTVQIGAKIQLGGLKEGLASPAYHGTRLGNVASCPIMDAAATATRAVAAKPKSRRRATLSKAFIAKFSRLFGRTAFNHRHHFGFSPESMSD